MKPAAISQVLLAAILILAGSPCSAQTTSLSRQRETAFALEQQGKDAEAEAAWHAILNLRPGDAEAWAHLGFLEARQQHYAPAIADYRKASALNPSMPGLQLNLGLALFKDGQLRRAAQVFQPLLQGTPPDSPDAQRLRILIGMADYGIGDYAAAVPWLQQAMARDPGNLPYRLVLANSCLRAKEYQCVLKVDREILALNPNSAEADILAGEALDAMQDRTGAIEQFRAAVAADPREPDAHFGLGYLLWCQSHYQEAAQQFQIELQIVPGDPEAIAYLADSERQIDHPEIARPLAEQAIRIDPHDAMPHLDLGILDADAGQNQDALRELKIAARISPNTVQVHWRLARLYQTMGKKEQAQAEFDLTKKLNAAADQLVSKELDAERSQRKQGDAPPPASPPAEPNR